MRVRLKDVAEALDLSISAVNAALRNRSNISRSTRLRVLQKAKELNYHPNLVARSLVMQKTQVLGMVVPDLSRSFFTEVMKGIDEVVSASDYHLLVCNTGENPTREDAEIAALISNQVDGLFIASAHEPGENAVWKALRKSGVPFVLIDRFFSSVPFVGGDDESIGFIATQHLVEQGYRNIAHLKGPNLSTGIGRYKGYLRAVRASGMRVRQDLIVGAEYHTETSGYEGTKRLLKLRRPPDAVFAASDPIAIGAMQAVEEAGLRLPVDFGVIGVGRVRYGERLSIPLSTLDQHRIDIGKLSATMLLGMINGEPGPAEPILVRPTLIVRDSSCRLPEAVSGNSRGGASNGKRLRAR